MQLCNFATLPISIAEINAKHRMIRRTLLSVTVSNLYVFDCPAHCCACVSSVEYYRADVFVQVHTWCVQFAVPLFQQFVVTHQHAFVIVRLLTVFYPLAPCINFIVPVICQYQVNVYWLVVGHQTAEWVITAFHLSPP